MSKREAIFKRDDYTIGDKLRVLATTILDSNQKAQIRPLAQIQDNCISLTYRQQSDTLKVASDYENNPSDILGIWDISITENRNNPDKKFINTRPKLQPSIYLVIDKQMRNDNLIQYLKNEGINKDFYNGDINGIFFLFTDNVNNANSILLYKDHFDVKDDKLVLNQNEYEWDGYQVLKEDIIKFADYNFLEEPLSIYRQLSVPPVVTTVTEFKTLDELIYRKFLDFLKQSYKSERGKLKKYQDEFLNFLDNVEFKHSQYSLFKTKYNLTDEDIQHKLQNLQKELLLYVDGNQFDANFINQLIKNNDEVKKLFIKEAKEEINKQITNEKEQLQEIKDKIIEQEKQLDHKAKEYSEKEAELINIDKKRKQLESTTDAFIANIKNKIVEVVPKELIELFFNKSHQAKEILPKNDDDDNYLTPSYGNDKDPYKLNGDINELKQEGAAQLTCVGVNEIFAESFIATLLACYISNQHIILAGPKAEIIADALSMFITGRHAAVYRMPSVFTYDAFDTINNNKEKIIILKNALNIEWISKLPEIASNSLDKLLVITHPFTEDLILYPQSLYKYFLPIFTEPVLAKDYINNDLLPEEYIITDNLFEIINNQKIINKRIYHLPLLKFSNYQSSIYTNLLKTVSKITNDEKNITIARFLLLEMPYLFSTGHETLINEGLLEKISDDEILQAITNFIGSNDDE